MIRGVREPRFDCIFTALIHSVGPPPLPVFGTVSSKSNTLLTYQNMYVQGRMHNYTRITAVRCRIRAM